MSKASQSIHEAHHYFLDESGEGLDVVCGQLMAWLRRQPSAHTFDANEKLLSEDSNTCSEYNKFTAERTNTFLIDQGYKANTPYFLRARHPRMRCDTTVHTCRIEALD